MSLLDDVSIVVTPNGYKAGELYAVVPVPVEGSELVTNGDFSADASWTKGTGWTISSGKASSDGSQTGNSELKQQNGVGGVTLDLQVGKQYKMIIDITVSTGAITYIEVAGNTNSNDINATGVSTLYFSPTSTNDRITIAANSTFVGSVNSISVKEYTSADMDVTRETAATRVDEAGLVNFAEIIGSDLVTNGDFADATGWTISGAWSLGTNKVIFSDTTNGDIRTSSAIFTATKTYQIKLKVADLTGANTAFFAIGDGSASNLVGYDNYANGDYTFNAIAPNGSELRIFSTTSSGSSYSITNISVKEVTRDNVPRIDYTGGGCPHILAEPQRTNLVTYSEDLSQWSLTNGTLTPNATVSPDGTQNAGRVVFNNLGVDLKRTITVVAGQTYTISFYIKLESGTGLDGRFYDNNNGANIEVYDYTSQIQGTEWSKITRSVTAPIGCTEMQIWLLASSSSLVTASFWGAQFEEGSYATSYIPTSGSTVTRNQDVFTRDGIASLINSTEGVLFLEMAALSNDGTFRQITLSDGTTNNRILVDFTDASNQIRVFCSSGGASQVSETFNITSSLSFNKIAFKYKLNDFALWVNGVEVATDTSGNTPIGLNKLSFHNGAGSFDFYGKVKQLQVYKTALTDNQLIQLTGESGTHFFESYAEMASALTYTIQ